MPGKCLLLLVLCSSLGTARAAVDTSASEEALIRTLLNGYSKDARPPPVNQSTEVNIELYLSSVDDIEEHLLTISIAGVILATWMDNRLTWNPLDYNGLDRIVLGAKDLWKPDFALTDACGDVFNEAYFADYYGISVSPTGNVTWTLEGSICVRCDFDLTYYPFDSQTCDLRYESFNYPSYLLHLNTKTSAVKLDNYHENTEFALVSTAAITEEFVPELDGNYSTVTFTLTLKRRQLYFMLNLILPCVLMAVLTSFIFLLPVTSKERIGLAITLLVAFSVFQMIVAGYLPVNSLTSTLLSNFIIVSTCFNGGALIITILLTRNEKKGDQELPPWLEMLFLRKLGVLFGITPKDSLVGDIAPMSHMSPLTAGTSTDSSQHSSMFHGTIKYQQLWHLSECVKNVETMMKTQHGQSRLVIKWNTFGKVVDITMFVLFTVAVVFLCITSLVLLPRNSV